MTQQPALEGVEQLDNARTGQRFGYLCRFDFGTFDAAVRFFSGVLIFFIQENCNNRLGIPYSIEYTMSLVPVNKKA